MQWTDRGAREASHAGEAPLELLPKGNASLRVLVSPWAYVAIDGEHVETTPFARAIPLSPGRTSSRSRTPRRRPSSA